MLYGRLSIVVKKNRRAVLSTSTCYKSAGRRGTPLGEHTGGPYWGGAHCPLPKNPTPAFGLKLRLYGPRLFTPHILNHGCAHMFYTKIFRGKFSN